ncbi:hypothetical protein TrLO_g4609 [Triparma laevis f. longispina]|uniref:Uncharacterized protein n=1 Tax=Triparma laevis f. longispina TaxID=1714387 RepID=A0A9W7L0P7_9STRA|nr:hypothetical protein TrLO_g4609 [Triparma laevis f. longispina]
MACITTGYAVLYTYFVYIEDEDEKEKIYDFWTWATLPISLTAMGISLLWFAILKFAMNSRSHIAELQDKDLSHFLTNDVIMGGVIIGLGQLAFLNFASIQCDNSNSDDWRQCNRTLISQTGLSGMVFLYVIIKIASGVVPEHILERHVFSMKKVVAMSMNTEESVQAFGLAIAIGCALFSLGGHGAKGGFGYDAEKYAAFTVPSVGGGFLFLTAV